jgi:hypothetical protein
MGPNEESNIDVWANLDTFGDDGWNPDWDEFLVDWPDTPRQPSTGHAVVDYDWQMDPDDLMNQWEVVYQEALESNRVSGLFQVIIPFAVVRVLER